MKNIAKCAILALSLVFAGGAFAQHHGGGYGYHGGGYHGGHGGNNAAWFVGGALVGSLATHAYDNSYRQPTTVYYEPSTIYYREEPVYCRDYNGYAYQCGTRTVREP